MFIEKLKKQDVKNYFKFCGFRPDEIKYSDGVLCISFVDNNYKYNVGDFTAQGVNLLSEEEVLKFTAQWRDFMSNMFGEKYDNACKKFYEENDLSI